MEREGAGAFASEAWGLVAQGRPLGALERFHGQLELSPQDEVGAFRSRVDAALELALLRDIALQDQAIYLDAELEATGAQGPDREIFAIVRAEVALEAGEDVEISDWLKLVPATSPLTPLQDALVNIERKIALDHSDITPALKWYKHVREWDEAVSRLKCGVTRASRQRRVRVTAWKSLPRLPSPEAMAGQLELETPDFAGRCGRGIQLEIGLYDTSLYTTLSVMALQKVAAEPDSSPPGRFYQLLARQALQPGQARVEACEVASLLDSPTDADDLPYFVFSPWLDRADMAKALHGLCTTPDEGCQASLCGRPGRSRCPNNLPPCTSSKPQEELEHVQRWARRCYAELASIRPGAGALAEQLDLYAPAARERYAQRFMSPFCTDSSRADALGLLFGRTLEGSGWQSQRLMLRWIQADIGLTRYHIARGELLTLLSESGLFRPLREMTRLTAGRLESRKSTPYQ